MALAPLCLRFFCQCPQNNLIIVQKTAKYSFQVFCMSIYERKITNFELSDLKHVIKRGTNCLKFNGFGLIVSYVFFSMSAKQSNCCAKNCQSIQVFCMSVFQNIMREKSPYFFLSDSNREIKSWTNCLKCCTMLAKLAEKCVKRML